MRDRLQELFQADIELIAGRGGVFDIVIKEPSGSRLVFSKQQLGRFPTDEELQNLK